MTTQYVIKRGIEDNIDYNYDGRIDSKDDIVIKYVDGKEVERRLLTTSVDKQIDRILQKNDTSEEQQRIIYQRIPTAQPPPVAIKDETSLGQYVKAGFGISLGNTAVQSLGVLLGSLFSSNGGKRKRK